MPKKEKTKVIKDKEEETEGLIKPRRTKKSEQKRLIEMQMADGKLYNKHGVKSITELLSNQNANAKNNDRVIQNYKPHDLDSYEHFISNLNTSDLQSHATTVGVMPNQDRSILIKRLLKDFRIKNSEAWNTEKPVELPKKIRQETLDILAQGR
jgi:hypothetical protein